MQLHDWLTVIISALALIITAMVAAQWLRYLPKERQRVERDLESSKADAGTVESMRKSISFKAEASQVIAMKEDLDQVEKNVEALSAAFNRTAGETQATLRAISDQMAALRSDISELRKYLMPVRNPRAS